MEKKFHISDLLSVTTGKMVSINHMDGVYDVLSFVYGRDVYTHEIPDLMPKASEHILSQLPFLREVTADDVTPENLNDYIINKVDIYKEYHSIKSI